MMDVVAFSPPAGGRFRASRIEDIRQHVADTFGLQVENSTRDPRRGEMGQKGFFRGYLTAVRLG